LGKRDQIGGGGREARGRWGGNENSFCVLFRLLRFVCQLRLPFFFSPFFFLIAGGRQTTTRMGRSTADVNDLHN